MLLVVNSVNVSHSCCHFNLIRLWETWLKFLKLWFFKTVVWPAHGTPWTATCPARFGFKASSRVWASVHWFWVTESLLSTPRNVFVETHSAPYSISASTAECVTWYWLACEIRRFAIVLFKNWIKISNPVHIIWVQLLYNCATLPFNLCICFM